MVTAGEPTLGPQERKGPRLRASSLLLFQARFSLSCAAFAFAALAFSFLVAATRAFALFVTATGTFAFLVATAGTFALFVATAGTFAFLVATAGAFALLCRRHRSLRPLCRRRRSLRPLCRRRRSLQLPCRRHRNLRSRLPCLHHTCLRHSYLPVRRADSPKPAWSLRTGLRPRPCQRWPQLRTILRVPYQRQQRQALLLAFQTFRSPTSDLNAQVGFFARTRA